jgi:pimeloyl-ACP methyl ester carboxylesterase
VIVDVDSTAGQSDESNDRIKAPLKVKTANRPPVLTKIESPPDKGVATGQPWFRMQAEDPDGDRVTYRIELKYYSSPPSLPSTFPTPDYVFDQKAAESKGWWMPGDEWRQTENRRVQSRAYASGAIAQFQPKAKLREGYYLWRVIVTDERGAVYETPREKWKTFRVIHHNPIVLVHGFNFGGILKQILWGQLAGAQLPLNNPANWNEAVKVIKSFGYIPLYEAYHEDTQTHVGSANDYADLFVVDNLNTSLRVDTNGNLMREYMFREVRPRISYETVVDLIGHSMGGLIARAYVGLLREKVGRGWAVSLAFNGEVGVERIVTLGTPHSGASLADAWWAKLLKWLFKDLPAVQDLSLEGTCNLNKAYPVTEGIQYLLFAAEIDVSALLANIFHPGSVTLKSDGIVDVESAHWKWYCKREQRRRPSMPNVIEIPPLNMGFDWLAHFNLISPETTRWWMAQYLRKGGFKSYKVIATNQQKRQQLEETQSTELWLSFVQQGQEISREVFLDETSDAAFITNWLVGQISFTLQSPTGQQITPEQAREGGDIQFFEIPHILGTFKVFLIKNASQGRWVMRVRGESEIPPDGTPALMWAAFHSPLKLNVDIPKAIYSIGEGAVLKAQLMKASQPVTGATVTAEVIQPDGQSVTVNLLDDGEHQDGKAGDGVYGAVLTNLTEPGTYRFIVTAKGQTRQEGGTNFERSAMGSFEVASPAARLTGRYTDEGMDEDNDGLFERLRVDVQVQIQQAGSFTLSGALADGAGRTITQTSVSFEATEAGVMTISLFFDGQAIGNWNYSGRFQLRDVTLLHRTDRGMVFADSHDHPYDTREYQANQFPSTLIRQSIALREGLHFVSVPMDLVNAGWSFLLGQIPSEVKVAVWMGNGYVFYPQEPANEAQTGRGYWVKLLPGQVRELTAIGRKVSEEQPFVLPLRQGWNAIGNPFLASLTWNLDSLKVRKGTEEKTLEQAQQAGWIEDYAWGWEQDANNPNTGRYVLVYDTSIIPGVKGQLEPWKGYWVYAHTDCELILPPPSQSKGRGTRGKRKWLEYEVAGVGEWKRWRSGVGNCQWDERFGSWASS